jgi:hypothetical protein
MGVIDAKLITRSPPSAASTIGNREPHNLP